MSEVLCKDGSLVIGAQVLPYLLLWCDSFHIGCKVTNKKKHPLVATVDAMVVAVVGATYY